MIDLILVDLSSIFWQCWHATADQELGAAYSLTLGTVRRLASGYKYCAICCDHPPYFRKQLSADYKAQRDAPPPQAVEQFRRVKHRLAADAFLLWSVEGFEADDLIATAVKHAARDDISVTIASGDKDLLSLVTDESPGVRQVKPTGDSDVFNQDAVQAKFGVPPWRMRDLLALCGDPSDNVPGVPGIGPKKAAKLLADFGTIDNLLISLESLPAGKLRQSLTDNEAQLRLSQQLVTLRDDVPIDWEALFEERTMSNLTEDSDYEDVPAEEEDEQEEDVEAAEKKDDMVDQIIDAKPIEKPAEVGPEQARAKPVTALAKVESNGQWSLALEPSSFGGAWSVAKMLFNSRLYPQFASPEAACAVIMRGRELGLGCATALANFHIVEGRPTMHADLIRGLVMVSGKAEYFDLVESTRDKSTWTTKRKGAKHEASITFTIIDACDAGLVQRVGNDYKGVSRSGKPSNWDKYRRTMLRHRAGVELARAVYPDVTAGLYTPEEVSDGVVTAEFEEAV